MDKIFVNRNNQPLKIALIGGARTGKDTIAGYLGAVADFKRVAFGDALKEMLFTTFSDLPEYPKPRKEMISFGQFCRTIDPLVWIKHVDNEVKKWQQFGYENIVITDVRQENEIDYCKQHGYTLVKVVASQEAQIRRALAGEEILDVNNELDIIAKRYTEYDYIIENNGSLLELYEQVDKILQEG